MTELLGFPPYLNGHLAAYLLPRLYFRGTNNLVLNTFKMIPKDINTRPPCQERSVECSVGNDRQSFRGERRR